MKLKKYNLTNNLEAKYGFFIHKNKYQKDKTLSFILYLGNTSIILSL